MKRRHHSLVGLRGGGVNKIPSVAGDDMVQQQGFVRGHVDNPTGSLILIVWDNNIMWVGLDRINVTKILQ